MSTRCRFCIVKIIQDTWKGERKGENKGGKRLFRCLKEMNPNTSIPYDALYQGCTNDLKFYLLTYRKVQNRIHKYPPPVPILSQLYPVHAPTTHFLKILILSSHLGLGLPNGLFLSGFPTKTRYTPLLYPIRATCPTQPILLDLITRKMLGEQYRSASF